MENISINFKVTGTDLDKYMASVQEKANKLTEETIRGAIKQADKGKELIEITRKQISELERKAKMETTMSQNYAQILANRQKASADQLYKNRWDEITNSDLPLKEKYRRRQALQDENHLTKEGIDADFNKYVTELKDQRKESKLHTSLAKENIEAIKQAARENVTAIKNGDKSLESVIASANTDEEKLVAKLTQEGLKKEQRPGAGEASGVSNIVGSLLSVDNLNKVLAFGGQLAQSKNGYDMIQTSAGTFGRIAGGIIGGIIGTIVEPGFGTVAGAGFGASIAGSLGDAGGAYLQRAAIEKNDYLKAQNRYRSITGRDLLVQPDTAGIGTSATEFTTMVSDYARRRGSSGNAAKTLLDALYAEKGVGVDQGTSAGLIELQRSAKENNRDLAGLIAGVLQKGQGSYFKNGDTTFLNEFLGKFTTLQKDLLKTSTTVGTGTTYDIMSRFNSLGGEFATSDPRSQGILATINGALSNPGSDMKKAMAFYALKKANPNMSLADLIEEQQKGLGSSTYLSSMMNLVNSMGGDESAKRLNFAGLLGLEGNQKWASDVYSGFKAGKFKNGFAMGDLTGSMDFKGMAEGNTTQLEKNTATISDGIIKGALATADAIADAVEAAIKDAFSGAVIEAQNGTIHFDRVQAQANKTPKAKTWKDMGYSKWQDMYSYGTGVYSH